MSCVLLPFVGFHGNQYNLGTMLLLWVQVDKVEELKVSPHLLRNIRLFGYTVVLNLVLRIAMYAISGVIMKGKVPSYANITQ
jgi:hypothetical protein